MALPDGCPPWNYDKQPNYPEALAKAHLGVLNRIQANRYTVEPEGHDPRPLHERLFHLLTPPAHGYYAGQYRGFHKRCLRNYEVMIQSDPLVGVPAARVPSEMKKFGDAVVSVVTDLEKALGSASALDANKARVIVQIACDAFVGFLTIHPFADGNGHVARSLLWIILRRFGFVPDGWTIEPRPPFPEYSRMIAEHRRGRTEPLIQFVLSSISVAQAGTKA